MRYTYSEKGALKGRYGSVPLATTTQIIGCTCGVSTSTGRFTAMSGTSTPFSIGPSKCADLSFMVDTSGATLGKTYRFRVINGSTTVGTRHVRELPNTLYDFVDDGR